MSSRGHIPIRLCVGCGSRRAKAELIRLGRPGERSPSGDSQGAGGKGYYLCPDPACLAAARKKMKRRGSLGELDFAFLESLRVRDKEKQEERE